MGLELDKAFNAHKDNIREGRVGTCMSSCDVAKNHRQNGNLEKGIPGNPVRGATGHNTFIFAMHGKVRTIYQHTVNHPRFESVEKKQRDDNENCNISLPDTSHVITKGRMLSGYNHWAPNNQYCDTVLHHASSSLIWVENQITWDTLMNKECLKQGDGINLWLKFASFFLFWIQIFLNDLFHKNCKNRHNF